MKRIPLLIALALILSSCSSPRWQLQGRCTYSEMDEVLSLFEALLTEQGMVVTRNDEMGIVEGRLVGAPVSIPTSFDVFRARRVTNIWHIRIVNQKIHAQAVILTEKGVPGLNGWITESYKEKYVRDGDISESWYRNVRDRMSSICDSEGVVFVKNPMSNWVVPNLEL